MPVVLFLSVGAKHIRVAEAARSLTRRGVANAEHVLRGMLQLLVKRVRVPNCENVERLVEELGSVELAKHAVDLAKQAVAAVAEQASSTSSETLLHRCLGYATQQKLRDASSPVESNDGKGWFLVQLPDESWVVWNEVDYKADRHYLTDEEARASVPHEAEFTGTSLLG